MKRYIRFSLPFAVMAAALIALSPRAAASEAASGDLPGDVVVAVKTASLKELADDIVSVARRVAPGPQVEAMPFMLGAMLGDPMLEGVEAGRNIGAALMEVSVDPEAGEFDLQPVVFARLTPESPYRETLRAQGMEVLDFEGWTFAAPQGFSLEGLGERRSDLIEWVELPRRHDIELYLNAPAIGRYIEVAEPMVREELAGTEAAEYKEVIPSLMRTITGELRIMNSAGLALDLSEESITQHAHLLVDSDTALGRFLSADHRPSFEPARWVDGAAPLVYLNRTNLDAARDYVDYFLTKAEAGGGKVMAEIGVMVRELVALSAGHSDGSNAGFLRMAGFEAEILQVYDLRGEEEELRRSLEKTLALMEHPVISKITAGFAPVQTRTELEVGERTINDLPVLTMRTGLAEESEGDAFFRDAFEQEMFYVKVGNFVVAADRFENLENAVRAVASGESPTPSAADLLDPESDAAGQVRLDAAALVSAFSGFIAPGLEIAADLPPALGELRIEDSALRWRFDIPVALVAGLYREIQAHAEEAGEDFQLENGYKVEE